MTGTSTSSAPSGIRSVPLAMLSEGLVLASSLLEGDGRLLLGAGIPITRELILGLHKRNVRSVLVTDKDWQRLAGFSAHGTARHALPRHENVTCDLHVEATQELDTSLDELMPCALAPSENPFSSQLRSPGTTRYDQTNINRMVDHHQQSVDQVRNLLGQLNDSQPVEYETLKKVTTASLMQAAEDLDLFVCMGINPTEETSIFTHSTNVATLAVAIGATLGLDAETLNDLGTGCLVHDAGMMKIDQEVIQSQQVLDENRFVEIAKHPIIATDMLYKNIGRVPLGVRMIVYQMHERCDGSGYPRGCTHEKIHPLAKIASVADAYVALVSKRPHRPAMLPYHAMAKILEDVKAGLYDPSVVRALLHTVSLFPIGSYVELSNGMVSKTIRANGPDFDRPIVEAWKRTHLSAPPQLVNLSEDHDVKIVKPLALLR